MRRTSGWLLLLILVAGIAVLASAQRSRPGRKTGPLLVVQKGRVWRPLALRPDGELLASGTSVFSVRTGRAACRLSYGDSDQTDVAWSPDGRLLLIASCDGSLVLWEVASQRIRAILKGHSGSTFAAFHPDQPVAASTDYEGRTFLWDTNTGQRLRELKGQPGKGLAVAFQADWLAVRTAQSLALWDWRTGQQVRSLALPMDIGPDWFDPHDRVARIVFDGSGRWLALADDTPRYGGLGTLRLVRVPELEIEASHQCYGSDCFLQGDGFVYNDRKGRLHRLVPGSKPEKLGLGAREFALAGNRMVLLEEDKVRVRDLDGKASFPEPSGPAAWLRDLSWCPRGLLLQTLDQTILVPDGHPGRMRRLDRQEHDFFEQAQPRVRGNLLALPGRYLRLLDLESGESTRVADLERSVVRNLSWSPDGSTLAIELGTSYASSHIPRRPPPLLLVRDGRVAVRNQPPERGDYRSSRLAWFGFAPDGRLLGLVEDELREFSQRTLTPGKSLGRLGTVSNLEFGPAQVAAVDGDVVRIWSYPGLQLRQTLPASKAWSLAFSPDGRLLATGGGKICLVWDSATGRQVARLAHPEGVCSLGFSRDGRTLLTCSDSMRIWDVPSGNELGAMTLMDDGGWLVLSPEGWWDGSPGIEHRSDFRLGSRVYPVANLPRRPGLLEELLRGERPEPAPLFRLRDGVEL